ncbi:MAG: MOSC domain-containing protein [bacterium]|nr:MOSC domain-containing protein [bacterium]MCP4798952.1 MOSC domain-containing protein [bacterium]
MKIEAVCISKTKGIVKTPVPEILLIKGFGIDGDAHAGKWHRQVSLLARESIDNVKKILPDLEDGAFAENLITSGVDWRREASVGDIVSVGDTVMMEVTQIGKECHSACAIGVATGDCIMPREGIFCKVLVGGAVKAGDSLRHMKAARNEA